MFNQSLLSIIIGLGSGGAGVGLGGVVACGFDKRREKVPWVILAVAAGMIFSLLAFELLPESIALGGYMATFSGIAAGLLLIGRLENYFKKIVIITGNPQRSLFIRSGILFALGIAIHNFPVGFALGTGLVNQPRVGFDLATTMLFHNFPEGLAMSLPMVFAGVNRVFIPLMASMVSIPAGVGALLGSSLGAINSSFLTFFFGIAIGTIFLVTWHEVLGHTRKKLCLAFVLPCVVGGILIGKLFTLFLL